MESSSALEVLCDDVLYKYTCTVLLYITAINILLISIFQKSGPIH